MKRFSKEIRELLAILLFNLAFVHLQSAWFDNLPCQIRQPDGTVVNVLQSGDEFHNWVHDVNGYTMIKDQFTGYWCWALLGNGDLISSGYPIHQQNAQSRGLSPGINISAEKYQEKRKYTEDSPQVEKFTKGTLNNLVIFISFDDVRFSKLRADLLYQDFNDKTTPNKVNVNSKYQYFIDASYGQLSIISHFYPPPAETIMSYQSSNSKGWYLPYDAEKNIGYTNAADGNERQDSLLIDAINHVSSLIPSHLDIDINNDGFVDHITFIIAGYPAEYGTTMWSHHSTLNNKTDLLINNKKVGSYDMIIESQYTVTKVGLLVHEFGHALGAPDLYSYPNTERYPIDRWDVMAHQTNPPQSMSAYTKWKYMKWVDNIPLITESGKYTLNPITVNKSNHAYRINSPYTDLEYFIVEYRSNKTGQTDSMLSGSGLIIYRIDINKIGNTFGHLTKFMRTDKMDRLM